MIPSRRESVLFGAVLALVIGLEIAMGLDRRAPAEEPVWSFYGRILGQEVLLLAGIWSLARRRFERLEIVSFVAVAALGSTIWAGDPDVNLGAVFGVPLLIEGVRLRRWIAASAVAVVQCIDLPVGLLPAPFLAVAAWFGLRHVSGRGFLILVPLAALSAWGPVLENAGLRHPGLYLDFFLGVGLSARSAAFCGFFTAAFAMAGTGGRDALRLLLALLGLGVVLAAWGTAAPVGVTWVRFAVVLAAGAGLRRLLDGELPARSLLARAGAGLLAAALVWAALSASLVLERREVEDGLGALAGPPEYFSDVATLSDLLGASAVGALLSGCVILLLTSRRRAAPFALALLLFLHPLDVFGWKSRMTWLRTVRKEGP